MSSVFDPASFMDVVITEEGATKTIPFPPGDYLGVLGEAKTRIWNSKDGTKSGLALDVPIELELTEEIKTKLGRDKYTVKYDCMIELTPEGQVDMGVGKNVRLNQLREACGLNKSGVPFSFRMFQGKLVKAKTKQRVDGENIYTDVAGVAKPN